MKSGQGKSGRTVVPSSRVKRLCRVAGAAIGHRKQWSGCGVRRGVGALPAAAKVGVQVAAGISAIGRRDSQCIIIVDVAGSAGLIGVAIRQRETGGAVIESLSQPTDIVVASTANCNRKSRWSR